MLMTEWKLEDALAVRFEEGIEIGLEKGFKQGQEKKEVEIARNALMEGASIEFVKKITGFEDEAIRKLQESIKDGIN